MVFGGSSVCDSFIHSRIPNCGQHDENRAKSTNSWSPLSKYNCPFSNGTKNSSSILLHRPFSAHDCFCCLSMTENKTIDGHHKKVRFQYKSGDGLLHEQAFDAVYTSLLKRNYSLRWSRCPDLPFFGSFCRPGQSHFLTRAHQQILCYHHHHHHRGGWWIVVHEDCFARLPCQKILRVLLRISIKHSRMWQRFWLAVSRHRRRISWHKSVNSKPSYFPRDIVVKMVTKPLSTTSSFHGLRRKVSKEEMQCRSRPNMTYHVILALSATVDSIKAWFNNFSLRLFISVCSLSWRDGRASWPV